MTKMGHQTQPQLRAAVLAGGQGSRMGEDKALLRLESDGPTLLEATIQRVAKVAREVIVVAPEDRDYRRFRVETIPDDTPKQGVLGGIATALRHFDGNHVLVVACDHPFLSVALLRHMADIDEECDVIIPRTRGASRQSREVTFQTLHAIYRTTCQEPLAETIERGYASAMDFFDRVRVRALDEPELRLFDPQLESLISVNTPETLAAARRLAAKQSD